MFETSVVRAQAKGAERRAALLTVSVAAHAVVIVAVVAASVATVRLPRTAPKQFAFPVFPAPELKVKLGDGGVKKTQTATAAVQPKRAAATTAVTAPRVVPDTVTPVTAQPGPAEIAGPPGDATSGPADNGPGVPWGDKEGVLLDGPPSTATPPAKIYTLAEGAKAPVVVHRVTPLYPEIARRMRVSGFVIVECVIDQTGHIRDAHVVRSSFGAFEQPALDAVQQWQFQPGTLNGRAVDVVFDLNITFQLH